MATRNPAKYTQLRLVVEIPFIYRVWDTSKQGLGLGISEASTVATRKSGAF